MTIRELPAINWLGYSIDLSRTSTMDIRAASTAILKGRRIISFDTEESLREVEIHGVVYDVPAIVRISEDPLFQGEFLSYSTGDEAKRAFRMDSGLPARYFAVTGADTALVLAHERSFIRDNQYALYSFTYSAYAARLVDFIHLLNEVPLLLGVQDLPYPFNGNDSAVLAAYKEFFQRFGTHALVSVSYGARFQLNAWASNSNQDVNAKFATDVKAYFNGIPNGGEYDREVKSESQYKVFLEYLQRLVTVQGGNPRLSSELTADPTDWGTYSKWSASVYTGTPTHIRFHTTAIWTLMSASLNATLRLYADQLDQAFTWILTRPMVYKTAVTFDIQSDWAEFNLLTPNALILRDDANPLPSETIVSPSRVQWGKEHSHVYQRQTLRFFIINDGSPVDFSISHGSDGAASGQGRAEVLIEREQYLNNVITDNVWNTVWFFGAPVALAPESFKFSERGAAYSWDDILDKYLHAITGPAVAA